MLPVNFEGAVEIKKPATMQDEECSSLAIKQGVTIHRPEQIPPHAMLGVTQEIYPYTLSCWKPSKEDIEAINAGRPIWVRILSHTVFPIGLFTTNEAGEIN